MLVERHRSFTLIEVLFVVAIVAILAATLIPRFASSTEDARFAALNYDLKAMGQQIQIYYAHHVGNYPTIQNNDLPQLTAATNVRGEIGPPGPDHPFGPYIDRELPRNPFDDSNKVTAVALSGRRPVAVSGDLGGWQYDQQTGNIWPNDQDYYRIGVAAVEAGEVSRP